ncbi:uncharacterized protein EI90DRAFT_3021153 [Cantharellus anzutake]|uniref:uncharacterized protein n=1 Tax=Cantharellus anzutake TaxID=1750568 RepID=UPI0019062E47|nr:uncharacterized protein EI90DRAFT_3021153 [Cantharellus anzutake]KAF8318081.1 hypothetical protein EI90DRAFT_3021153 [Cantharellus anzutake]
MPRVQTSKRTLSSLQCERDQLDREMEASRKRVHEKIAWPRGHPDRVKGGFHLAEAMGIEKHEMTLVRTHLGKAFHNGMVQLQKLDYEVLWQIQNDVIAEHPWIKSDYEGAWPIQELIRTAIGNRKTGIRQSKQRKGGSVKRISRSTNEADEDHTESDKDCGGSDADREPDEDRSGLNEEPTGTDEDCNESDDSGHWGGTPQTRRKGTESTKQSSACMTKHGAKVDHPIKEPTGLRLHLHLNSKNAHDIVDNEGHPHASYYDNDNDSDNPTSGAEIEGGFMSAANKALRGKVSRPKRRQPHWMRSVNWDPVANARESCMVDRMGTTLVLNWEKALLTAVIHKDELDVRV